MRNYLLKRRCRAGTFRACTSSGAGQPKRPAASTLTCGSTADTLSTSYHRQLQLQAECGEYINLSCSDPGAQDAQLLSPSAICRGSSDKGQPCRVGGELNAGLFRARTPLEDAQEADAQDSPLGAVLRPSRKPAGRKVNHSPRLQFAGYACFACVAISGHTSKHPEFDLEGSLTATCVQVIYMACLPGNGDAQDEGAVPAKAADWRGCR